MNTRSPKVASRVPADGEPANTILEERGLVDRCVAGDAMAWDELYHRYHGSLRAAIRVMFQPRLWDSNLLDEIAARVWFAVVADGGSLLDRFDPSRETRLITFLAAIARGEATGIFRAERRRRYRELLASQLQPDEAGQQSDEYRFDEFRKTLTPRERAFFDSELMSSAGESAANDLTPANRWQLRSRIKSKLRRYIGDR